MIPRHVALIMDGNRRWAHARGMPAAFGYKKGVSSLRRTVRAAARAGIEVVTAYAFSEENWGRPRDEVDVLMNLCVEAACGELLSLVDEGVRVRICGGNERLPEAVRTALAKLVLRTADNSRITLNLAIDYGARREIRDAARSLAREVGAGLRDAESIDEESIAAHLYTAGLPDPDFIIRTGGELRLSNFLLFQAAYAEFWATPCYWPDFDERRLRTALDAFSSRTRRYGA